MQQVSRVLFLLHRDERLASALGALPGVTYRVERVADWEGLRDRVGKRALRGIIVADPFFGSPDPFPSEHLRALVAEHAPTVGIVPALRVASAPSDTLATLLGWGISEWLDLDREMTAAALSRRLRRVWIQPVERLLARALPSGVPSRTRMLLSVATEVVAEGGQAPEFARALGVGDRTVPRWCLRADLPPPRRLFAWLRLLLASELLDDPGRSLEGISRATGYAGAPSLKTALRNLLSLTPRELRERGAFATVALAFSNELFALREASRQDGRGRARVWLH